MKSDIRYSRLAMLSEIGDEGMARLRSGKILLVGCGALGSLSAMYLAASGIGKIGIADFDTIDLSNLQRQIFFDEASLGKSKAFTLKERMLGLNSEIKVEVYNGIINERSASEIFPDYDFVIDGSDNPSTKNLTAFVCETLSIPYCIGGVREYSGQVMSWAPGHRTYSDLFGDVPKCSGFTPCSLSGVLGPAAGVVASVQASEAIKHLSGAGQMLYDKLFVFNLAAPSADIFRF